MPFKLLIISIAVNLFLVNAASAQTRDRSARAISVSQRSTIAKQSDRHISKVAPTTIANSTTRPQLLAPPQIAKSSVVVTQFGAVPNDGTDDTAAIQTAIETIAQKGGGSVMFPPGTYNISRTYALTEC